MEDRFDSDFERDVYRRLITRGYRVKVQYRVGRFRIDLVVEGRHGRLAVELDGDAYHGPDRWEADRSRQAIPERLGWTFHRIRGSAYYMDPDAALGSLWDRLGHSSLLSHEPGAACRDTTQGPRRRVYRPEVTALIEAAVHELDISVHEIWDAIFGLYSHAPARDAAGLRARLLERVAASAELLGFTPGLPSATTAWACATFTRDSRLQDMRWQAQALGGTSVKNRAAAAPSLNGAFASAARRGQMSFPWRDETGEFPLVRLSTATSRLTGAGYECHHGPLKSTCTAWPQEHRVIAASARAEGRPPRGWP